MLIYMSCMHRNSIAPYLCNDPHFSTSLSASSTGRWGKQLRGHISNKWISNVCICERNHMLAAYVCATHCPAMKHIFHDSLCTLGSYINTHSEKKKRFQHRLKFSTQLRSTVELLNSVLFLLFHTSVVCHLLWAISAKGCDFHFRSKF